MDHCALMLMLSVSLFWCVDITLCEEAMFQFLLSPPLASVDLLLESLPGRKVDKKNVEPLKKKCSPEQQALHLLRLWREQNKDQGKLYSIIQGQTASHGVFRNAERQCACANVLI